jgi:nicotinamidase-related amidase
MGGNLGFEIYVVSDGCVAFDKKTLDGRLFRAEDVHALSLANMSGEYAEIVDSAWVMART